MTAAQSDIFVKQAKTLCVSANLSVAAFTTSGREVLFQHLTGNGAIAKVKADGWIVGADLSPDGRYADIATDHSLAIYGVEKDAALKLATFQGDAFGSRPWSGHRCIYWKFRRSEGRLTARFAVFDADLRKPTSLPRSTIAACWEGDDLMEVRSGCAVWRVEGPALGARGTCISTRMRVLQGVLPQIRLTNGVRAAYISDMAGTRSLCLIIYRDNVLGTFHLRQGG
jgi:hypothetical protein